MMVEPTLDPDQVVCRHRKRPGHYQKGCALFIKVIRTISLPSNEARLVRKAPLGINDAPSTILLSTMTLTAIDSERHAHKREHHTQLELSAVVV